MNNHEHVNGNLIQMEIKVRELTDVQEKSVQEVEQELLNKHEAQQEIKFDERSQVYDKIAWGLGGGFLHSIIVC